MIQNLEKNKNNSIDFYKMSYDGLKTIIFQTRGS